MADDATIKVTVDASGAQQGAAQARAAVDQIIKADQMLSVSAADTANKLAAAEKRKVDERVKTLRAAEEAATGEAKAAASIALANELATQRVTNATAKQTRDVLALAKSYQDTAAFATASQNDVGESFEKATRRMQTSTSSQTTMLNNYARAFDPYLAAVERATRQLENLKNVSAQAAAGLAKPEEGRRADAMIPQAAARLDEAQRNQSAGYNVATEIDRLTKAFAPALDSAQKMTAEIKDLNRALELGIEVEGGQAAQLARIAAKYDETAKTAAEAAAVIAKYNEALSGASSSGPGFFRGQGDASMNVDQTRALISEFDKGYAATLQFNGAMGRLNELEDAGIQIAGGYAAARAALRVGYEKDMDAVRSLLSAYGQQLVLEKVLADRASGTSTRGTTAGFSAAQQSMALTDDARKTARGEGIATAFNDADAMRARFDTIFANSQKYAKEWEDLDNVIKVLNLTEVQAAALHDNLSKSIERGIGVVEQDAAASEKAAVDKSASIQKLVMEFDQGAAITLRFNETMTRLNTLEESGTQITGGYAAARARLRAGYEQDMDAVRGLLNVYGQQEVMEKVLADRAAGTSSRGYGVGSAEMAQAMRDQQLHNARQSDIEGAFAGGDKQRAQFDSIFANSQKYESEFNKLNETVKILNLTEDQAKVMLDDLNKTIARGVGPVEQSAKADADKAAALQRTVDKYDVAGKAAREYLDTVMEINALERTGDLTPGAATTARAAAKNTYDATDPSEVAKTAALADAKKASDDLAVSIQRTVDKYDAVGLASREYEAELKRIAEAEKAEGLTTELAAAARVKAASARDDAIAKVDPVAIAEAEAKAQTDAMEAGRMKWDTSYRLAKQYEAAIKEINAFEQQGAFGPEGAAIADRARQQSQANYVRGLKDMEIGGRNAAFAIRQVGVQFTQGISGIATGQGVLTVLIQQGHQLLDVALATGTGWKVLGEAAKAAWGFITSPIVLAVAGIAAVAAAMATLATMAELAGRRLGVLRNDLSLSRKDYIAVSAAAEDAARHLAVTTNMSLSEAREGINSVLKTDQFKGQAADAEALVIAARKVALALGDVGKTADIASKIVANPSGVLADMLTAHPEIIAFNQQTVEAVKHLQDLGQQGNAVSMAAAAITRATAKQTEDLTPLLKAWHELERTLTGTGKSGNDLSTRLGTPLLETLTKTVTTVNNLVTAIERLYTQLKEAIPQGFLDFLDKMYKAGAAMNPVALSYKLATETPKPSEDTSRKVFDWLTSNQFKAPTPPTAASSTATPSATTDGVLQKLFDWLTSNQLKTATTTSSTSSSEGTAAKPYNYDAASEIAAGLVKRGMEVSDAIAFTANAIRESGGDFKKVNMDDAPGGSHGLFQWNKERLTAFKNENNGLLPEQTSMDRQLDFVKTEVEGQYKSVYQRVKAEQSQEGKARLVTSDYEVPKDIVGQGNISAGIARDISGRYSGVLDTVASNTKTDNQVRAAATDIYGKSLEDQRRQEQQKIDDAKKALALPDQDTSHIRAYNIQIQESEKRLYELVTASEAYEREQKLTTLGEERIAAAFRISAAEGERVTHQVEAEKTARQQLNPATAEYRAEVQRLTEANIRAATAQEHHAMAQKAVQNNNQTEVLAKEAEMVNTNTVVREQAIAQLKIEQDLKAKGIPLEDAYAQGLIKSSDAMIAQAAKTSVLNKNLNEMAGAWETAFNTIGSSIVDAFDNGKTAAQNFADLSKTIVKQILNEFIKLAVINPLLNSLFPGTGERPTLDGAMTAARNLTGKPEGGGGTGTLGTVVSLVGKVISLFGGGSALGTSGTSSVPDTFGGPITEPMFPSNTSGSAFMDNTSRFHAGGLVGFDGAPAYIHPAYFDDAPRYHGGLANDEVAAILQKGERVLTTNQTKQFDRMVSVMGSAMKASMHHGGGIAGQGRLLDVNPALFFDAPRFHDGMANDSIGALLDKGIGGLMEGQSNGARSASMNGDGSEDNAPNFKQTVNFNFPPGTTPDSFRRSMPQVIANLGKTTKSQLTRTRN